MTQFGKILVFVNVVLGLTMAAWALAAYGQRLEWARASKASPDQLPTEVEKRQERVKQANAARGTAEDRWRTAVRTVDAIESHRGEDRKWYAQELQKLLAGNQAVKAVVLREGKIEPDPALRRGQGYPWRPLLQDFKTPHEDPMKQVGLQPLAFYNDEMRKTQAEIDTVLASIGELIKEQEKLSLAIDGKNGLRERLARERDKQGRIGEEIADLRPLRINTAVDAQLLLKRQKQLQARVEELKRTGVARQP